MIGRFRFRDVALVLDEEPDAEKVSFVFQCAVCDATGSTEKAPDEAAGWTIAHLRTHSEHFTYRMLTALPYRVEPGDWS